MQVGGQWDLNAFNSTLYYGGQNPTVFFTNGLPQVVPVIHSLGACVGVPGQEVAWSLGGPCLQQAMMPGSTGLEACSAAAAAQPQPAVQPQSSGAETSDGPPPNPIEPAQPHLEPTARTSAHPPTAASREDGESKPWIPPQTPPEPATIPQQGQAAASQSYPAHTLQEWASAQNFQGCSAYPFVLAHQAAHASYGAEVGQAQCDAQAQAALSQAAQVCGMQPAETPGAQLYRTPVEQSFYGATSSSQAYGVQMQQMQQYWGQAVPGWPAALSQPAHPGQASSQAWPQQGQHWQEAQAPSAQAYWSGAPYQPDSLQAAPQEAQAPKSTEHPQQVHTQGHELPVQAGRNIQRNAEPAGPSMEACWHPPQQCPAPNTSNSHSQPEPEPEHQQAADSQPSVHRLNSALNQPHCATPNLPWHPPDRATLSAPPLAPPGDWEPRKPSSDWALSTSPPDSSTMECVLHQQAPDALTAEQLQPMQYRWQDAPADSRRVEGKEPHRVEAGGRQPGQAEGHQGADSRLQRSPLDQQQRGPYQEPGADWAGRSHGDWERAVPGARAGSSWGETQELPERKEPVEGSQRPRSPQVKRREEPRRQGESLSGRGPNEDHEGPETQSAWATGRDHSWQEDDSRDGWQEERKREGGEDGQVPARRGKGWLGRNANRYDEDVPFSHKQEGWHWDEWRDRKWSEGEWSGDRKWSAQEDERPSPPAGDSWSSARAENKWSAEEERSGADRESGRWDEARRQGQDHKSRGGTSSQDWEWAGRDSTEETKEQLAGWPPHSRNGKGKGKGKGKAEKHEKGEGACQAAGARPVLPPPPPPPPPQCSDAPPPDLERPSPKVVLPPLHLRQEAEAEATAPPRLRRPRSPPMRPKQPAAEEESQEAPPGAQPKAVPASKAPAAEPKPLPVADSFLPVGSARPPPPKRLADPEAPFQHDEPLPRRARIEAEAPPPKRLPVLPQPKSVSPDSSELKTTAKRPPVLLSPQEPRQVAAKPKFHPPQPRADEHPGAEQMGQPPGHSPSGGLEGRDPERPPAPAAKKRPLAPAAPAKQPADGGSVQSSHDAHEASWRWTGGAHCSWCSQSFVENEQPRHIEVGRQNGGKSKGKGRGGCAGVIAIRCAHSDPHGRDAQVCLVNTAKGVLGFPKGGAKHKEDALDNALREWNEETGLDAKQLHLITSEVLVDGAGIHYFVAEWGRETSPLEEERWKPPNEDASDRDPVVLAQWMSVQSAMRELLYQRKELLRQAVHLLKTAEKQSDSEVIGRPEKRRR